MTSQEPDADAALLERYRQASSTEGLEPTEAVRAAILAEARRIAQQRAAAPPSLSFDTSRPAANQSRFRIAAFGTFGVAILAALLIVPRWLISPASRPQMAETRSAPSSAEEAAAQKMNAPAAVAAPPPAQAPVAAPTPLLARSEPSPSAASRQSAAGAPAKRPTQSTTNQIVQPSSEDSLGTQLAENASPNAGGIFSQPSNADHINSDAVTAPRTAQNRTLSSSAAAAPAASPPPTSSSSQTPLLAAVAAGNLARATLLLDQHAPTEDRDGLGRTPLLVAAAEGQVEIVRLLLAHGADPNVVDKTGSTPLQLANRSQFREIAQLLEDAGAR